MRTRRPLSASLLAVGLAAWGLVAAAPPAAASACTTSAGVTVVVDTGGSVQVRCAGANPGSALAALQAAGFSVVTPQRFPGSVVCRIDGVPASDPCIVMPPATAYWAFFHAQRGGSWAYSSSGAASYVPAAGSVVGFRFGSGQAPSIAPPAALAPPPTPTPTTAAPKPTTAAPKPTVVAPKPTKAAPKPTTTTATRSIPASSKVATPTASSASPTASTPAPTATTTSAPPAAAAPPATGSASPGLPWLGGLGLVGLMAGAGVYAGWRRRAEH